MEQTGAALAIKHGALSCAGESEILGGHLQLDTAKIVHSSSRQEESDTICCGKHGVSQIFDSVDVVR